MMSRGRDFRAMDAEELSNSRVSGTKTLGRMPSLAVPKAR